MTVYTFKKFCLKANTKKSNEIHDYYIKLEDLHNETALEESDELKLQLKEKDKLIEENEIHHINDKKTDKHKFFLNKFKGKRCVYVAQVTDSGTEIKLGSSEYLSQRCDDHIRTYNKCVFLDVFECENFREIEKSILQDTIIQQNKYKEPINGHCSVEVVKLTDTFNYNQLINVITKYTNQIIFLTPEQILHKHELNLQDKKMKYDLINKMIDKNISINDIKELCGPIDFNTETFTQYNIIDRELNVNETNVQNNVNLNLNVKQRIPKGRSIQKIDPHNLKNIINVYPSMVYALRAPENNGFNKSGIQKAIKDSRIYKEFRWNFVNDEEDPNVSIVEETNEYTYKPPIIDSILQLNNDKTQIIETFYTKDFVAKHLKIGKLKMKKIIENHELYNNSYFIEYNKCSKELLDIYTKLINRIVPSNSKQIKQIHPVNKQIVIFNSLSEIYKKLGIAEKTITKAIKDKSIYSGSLWEYI